MASTTKTTYFIKQAKQIKWDMGGRLPTALRELSSAKNPKKRLIFTKAEVFEHLAEAEKEVKAATAAKASAAGRLQALFDMLADLDDLEPLERWNIRRVLLNTANPPPTPKELREEERAKTAYTLSGWVGHEDLSAADAADASEAEERKLSVDGEGGYRLKSNHETLPLDPKD